MLPPCLLCRVPQHTMRCPPCSQRHQLGEIPKRYSSSELAGARTCRCCTGRSGTGSRVRYGSKCLGIGKAVHVCPGRIRPWRGPRWRCRAGENSMSKHRKRCSGLGRRASERPRKRKRLDSFLLIRYVLIRCNQINDKHRNLMSIDNLAPA
jgi:hypothetical protein